MGVLAAVRKQTDGYWTAGVCQFSDLHKPEADNHLQKLIGSFSKKIHLW